MGFYCLSIRNVHGQMEKIRLIDSKQRIQLRTHAHGESDNPLTGGKIVFMEHQFQLYLSDYSEYYKHC